MTQTVAPDAVAAPLEALLLMATEPLSTAELALALDVPRPVVWEALESLARFYDETGRGFELREVGRGWRYYTRPEHGDVIGRWVLEGQHARLSQAALETLAVVAYLQPISRSRVSAIRGVNVDGVIRTLATRGLVEEAGPSEETGAMLFRTTEYFLERMGYASLDDLPALAPHLPEASALEAELAGFAETAFAPLASGVGTPLAEDVGTSLAEDVGTSLAEDVGTPSVEDVGTPSVEDVGTPSADTQGARPRPVHDGHAPALADTQVGRPRPVHSGPPAAVAEERAPASVSKPEDDHEEQK